MAAQVVYDDVAEGASAHLQGHLFAGKRFWVAQRIPSRGRYLESIRSNGGEVVMLEKQADYMIADHCRRDCPPGTISYTFIEKSIRNGEVADPEDHLAGPRARATREVGSSSRPTKSGRAPYTSEEDRILYNWVRDHERQGGLAGGNEIYKQLEAQHPRHTWQSWRDRYLKKLHDMPPTGLTIPGNAPPSPLSDQSAGQPPPAKPPAPAKPRGAASNPRETREEGAQASRDKGPRSNGSYTVDDFDGLFNKEDWEELYANVSHILESNAQGYIEGWEAWAKTTSQTAEQWRQYFEKVVRPQWTKDPAWKKENIKKRVMKRHEDEQKKEATQQTEEAQDEVDTAGPSNANVEGEQVEVPATAEPGSTGKTKDATNEALPIADAMGPSTTKPKRGKAATPLVDLNTFEALVDKFLESRKGRPAQEAYIFWAQKERQAIWAKNPGLDYGGTFADIAHASSTYYVKEVHRILTPRWKVLSDEEKAPYLTMEAADKRRVEMEQVKDQVLSSEMDTSTVAQETPQYIKRTHESIMKRIHEDNIDEFTEEAESSHQAKRRRSNTGSPVRLTEQVDFIGTQQQPLEISSGESSTSFQDADESQEQRQSQDQLMEDVIQAELQSQIVEQEVESEEEDQPTPTVELPDLYLQYPRLPTPDFNAYPADTPRRETTRGKQKAKASAFDTQAILSSPSRGYLLNALPRPAGTQAPESRSRSASQAASSPIGEQESIISATQSLREFRRSINEEDRSNQTNNQTSPFAPLPRPERNTSEAPSESDSQASGDPDLPLSPSELSVFFSDAHEDGFNDEEITAALKHTRMRPNLAEQVLVAWKDENPLPNARGIWSREDDNDVESGDGVALARLERKHTCDGWGGITERLRFLETCRGM